MEDIVKKELDTLLELMGIDVEYDLKIEENNDVKYIKISFNGGITCVIITPTITIITPSTKPG